jgi:serine/threonine-protein kinase
MGFLRKLFSRFFGRSAADQSLFDVPAEPPARSPRPPDPLLFDVPAEPPARSPRHKLPRPDDVVSIGGEDSPLVSFCDGRAVTIMDRDAFDYTYGDADGPDPCQRDLDDVLPRVSRVCVLEGPLYRGRAMGGEVLADVRDLTAISKLAACVKIVEDPRTFNHCMCTGGPVMELYDHLELIATLGLQHGRAIRWKQWYHDAQLQDGARLDRWLAEQGIDPAQLQSIYHRNFLMEGPKVHSEAHREALGVKQQAIECLNAGRLSEALMNCDRAQQIYSEAETRGLRGIVHSNMGRHDQAVEDCSAAIDRGVRLREVYFARAVAEDAQGKTNEALADLGMTIHLSPDHPAAYNSRGVILTRLGRLDEALKDLEAAVRLAPDWTAPHYNRTNIHVQRQDADALIAELSDVLRILPKAPTSAPTDELAFVSWRRGLALASKGQLVRALADFDQAIRWKPDFADALSSRAWLHLREKRITQAFEDFAEVICLAPEDVRGYGQRAQAYMSQGDRDRALDDLNSALRWQSDQAPIHVMRGQLFLQEGRTDEALADLHRAVELAPEESLSYVIRAQIYNRRGEPELARGDLDAALRVQPENAEAWNMMAWQLATYPEDRWRNAERAQVLARRACEKTDWKHANHLDTLAAACAEGGLFDEACRWQEKALALFPDGTDLGPYLARLACYQSGKPHRDTACRPRAL